MVRGLNAPYGAPRFLTEQKAKFGGKVPKKS